MNTEKLKQNLAHMGTNIHYVGSSLGSSVNNKLTGHEEYNVDDELITGFQHDIKQTMKAMKFLEKQSERMVSKYWPYFFKAGMKSAKVFLHLMGENSLTFDDIEKYYDEFDRLQITSESVQVHPKERQLTVPIIQFELTNYLATMDQLQTRVIDLATKHTKQLKTKTEALATHLKHILKVVKARNSHKAKCAKLEWKTDRLAKKKTPLSDQERKDLDLLETKLKAANHVFESLNERLKKVIPESLLLVEEFVEELTKWIICGQNQIHEEIEKTLRHYAVFHGYVKGSLEADQKDNDKILQTYEEILDQWETECTSARLQIESFIQTIYEKKPDLLDTEVDNKDKSSRLNKVWALMTLKVTEKLHTVKAQDLQNGIFTDHMIADPLKSFIKYLDLNLNVSETYHPHKVLDYDKVHPFIPEKRSPPPLPPRDDNHRILLPVNSPISSSTPFSNNYMAISSESLDSIHSDSELSLNSTDTDDESDTATTSDLSSIVLADDVTLTSAERQIIKLYNSSKNEITKAPLDTSHWIKIDRYTNISDDFHNKNTVSYKLHELNSFFQKALKHANEATREKRVLVAKLSFTGIQPGDLSFDVGDEVEVLFDLQSVSSSYQNDGRNWFVGATGDPSHRRIGFAPNTYF